MKNTVSDIIAPTEPAGGARRDIMAASSYEKVWNIHKFKLLLPSGSLTAKQSPLPLDDIAGYYSWVVDNSIYDDRFTMSYLANPEDEEHNATGGVTLTALRTPTTPADISGTVEFNVATLAFKSLVPAPRDVGGLTSWHLATRSCSVASEDIFDDEYRPLTITVMDVRDDAGWPFIRVEWSQAWGCTFYVIGKRQEKGYMSLRSSTGKILDLTDGEMRRLGISEERTELV